MARKKWCPWLYGQLISTRMFLSYYSKNCNNTSIYSMIITKLEFINLSCPNKYYSTCRHVLITQCSCREVICINKMILMIIQKLSYLYGYLFHKRYYTLLLKMAVAMERPDFALFNPKMGKNIDHIRPMSFILSFPFQLFDLCLGTYYCRVVQDLISEMSILLWISLRVLSLSSVNVIGFL